MEQKTVGDRIAAYRKEVGMSAQKLADVIGSTRSVITNIENGRREDVTIAELLSIAAALKVPPVALMFDVTRPYSAVHFHEVDDVLEPDYVRSVIDVIEWFAATDEADPTPAVSTAFGVAVDSDYGEAGGRARSLVRAARTLERARASYYGLRRDFLRRARDVWPEDRAESDQLFQAMDIGSGSTCRVGRELLERASARDRTSLEAALRVCDAAARNYEDAAAQFRSIGGDASVDPAVASARALRDLMNGVQADPLASLQKGAGDGSA